MKTIANPLYPPLYYSAIKAIKSSFMLIPTLLQCKVEVFLLATIITRFTTFLESALFQINSLSLSPPKPP